MKRQRTTAVDFAAELHARSVDSIVAKEGPRIAAWLRSLDYPITRHDTDHLRATVDWALREKPPECPSHVKPWERYSYWVRSQGGI